MNLHGNPLCLGMVITLVSVLHGFAAEHTMAKGDDPGSSSFNSGLNWTDGLAPALGETYLANHTLRTPEQNGSYTFLGDTLTVTASILWKGQNNTSITITDLILRGTINHGIGGVDANIHGNISIPAGASASIGTGLEADRRIFNIHAPVSGTGALDLFIPRKTSLYKEINLLAENSGFTGTINVRGTGKLGITSEASLGGNPPEWSPRQLTLNGSTLLFRNSQTLDDPNRGIWIGNDTDYNDDNNNTSREIYPGGKFEVGTDRIVTVASLIGGAGPFAKVDSGTLILAATNTYTGATSVENGALLINSATNATASITVAPIARLGGTGTVHCPVTFETGAGIALAGNGYGTLTLADAGGIALENAALSFDVEDGQSDSLALAGPLTVTGVNPVSLTIPATGLPAGTYTLATYPTLIENGVFTLAKNYPNVTLTTGPNALTLEIASGGTAPRLTWQGNPSDNVWDFSTPNWNPAGAVYADNMDVVFDDAGIASSPVTLTAATAPYTVTVATTNKAYTFNTGANTFSAYGLYKHGDGALTLNGNYAVTNFVIGWDSGNGFIGGGAVTLNGNLALTAGSFTLRPPAGTFNQAATSVISGSGGITYGCTANIRGTNTYTGTTTVGYTGHEKNFTIYNPHALGSTAGGTTLRGGTGGGYNKLTLAPGLTVTDEPLTVAGGSTLRAGLWLANAGAAHWDGDITIATDGYLLFGVDSTEGTLTVGTLDRTVVTNTSQQQIGFRGGGTIQMNSRLATPSGQLYRDDTGTLVINSSNNVTPNISFLQGGITINTASVFANTPQLTIGKDNTNNTGNKSIFDLNGFDVTLGRIMDLHADNYNGTPNEGYQRILCTVPSTLTVSGSADSSYAKVGSVMSGPLTLIKAGTGTLTLGQTNTLSGAVIVSNGVLAVASTGTLGPNATDIAIAGGTLSLANGTALCPAANVTFTQGGTGKIALPADVNVTVSTLWHGDKQKYGGTYGATGSGAKFTDDTRFTGSGTLTVLHGSGGTMMLLQ